MEANSSIGDNPSGDQESHLKSKVELKFDLYGQIIGNKNAYKARCLALAKDQIGVTYDDWRNVPISKKEDVWKTLKKEFSLPSMHKETLIDQVGSQWRTWKKNIRRYYLGTTREDILKLKDKVPEKEQIPVASWNIFIDREATLKKLNQRKKAKENRSKKKDVHCLGRTSYAELESRMPRDENGKGPDRTEVYLEARKQKKSKSYHPSVETTAEILIQLRNNQAESIDSEDQCLDNDALSQLFGKDTRGHTRGVGSTVSRTTFKATLPARTEVEKVKDEVNKHYKRTDAKMDKLLSSINHLISLHQGNENLGPVVGRKRTSEEFSSLHMESLSTPTISASNSGARKFYNVRDIYGKKTIAIGMIDSEAKVGTKVHHHPLESFEVKIGVIKVIQGMENEPLWLMKQGDADTIGETLGDFVAWPRHLLTKDVE